MNRIIIKQFTQQPSDELITLTAITKENNKSIRFSKEYRGYNSDGEYEDLEFSFELNQKQLLELISLIALELKNCEVK